jgi:hypothetical protein
MTDQRGRETMPLLEVKNLHVEIDADDLGECPTGLAMDGPRY